MSGFLSMAGALLSGVISFAAKGRPYAGGFALHRCRLESDLKSSGYLFQVNCSWQFPFNYITHFYFCIVPLGYPSVSSKWKTCLRHSFVTCFHTVQREWRIKNRQRWSDSRHWSWWGGCGCHGITKHHCQGKPTCKHSEINVVCCVAAVLRYKSKSFLYMIGLSVSN